jgi:spore maturation protein CgeB
MRMNALERLGHNVFPVNTNSGGRIKSIKRGIARVANKLGRPLDFCDINSRIISNVKQHHPHVVWIDKGLMIWSETLLTIKEWYSTTKIVGYSPDDMAGPHNQSKYWLEGLPLYDCYFTTKSYNVPELHVLGAKRITFVGNAFDPDIHRPVKVSKLDRLKYGGPVGFIGAWELERAKSIMDLAKAGIDIRVWGWTVRGRQSKNYSNLCIESKPLLGQDYAKGINSFDINLCFLRKINRDRQTTRSVEIPASGAFMLAERTDEHLELFEEGKEAEFFGSTEELIDKTKYYLKNESLRRKIAAAGRERCLDSGYDYPNRMRWMLQKAMKDHD